MIALTVDRSRCTRNTITASSQSRSFICLFGGTLDPENRWVLFASLMPWEELEATYALNSIQLLALLQSL